MEHVRAGDLATVAGGVEARCSRRPPARALVEALEIVFPPGKTRPSNPHPAGVIEHVLLTEGRLRAGPDGRDVEMDTGDVLRFAGDVPHEYAALDGEPAGAIAADGLPVRGGVRVDLTRGTRASEQLSTLRRDNSTLARQVVAGPRCASAPIPGLLT